MSIWNRAYPSQSQILIDSGLIKSAAFTLTTPWDTTSPQMFTSTQQVATRLVISGRFSERPQPTHRHWEWTCISLVNTTLSYPVTYSEPAVCSMRTTRSLAVTGLSRGHWRGHWLADTSGGGSCVYWAYGWHAPRPGVDKKKPWCEVWSIPHIPRSNRSSLKLWINRSSKQDAQG